MAGSIMSGGMLGPHLIEPVDRKARRRAPGGSVPRHTPGSSFLHSCGRVQASRDPTAWFPPFDLPWSALPGVLDTWNEDTRGARQAAVMPRCSRICVTRPRVPGNSIKPAARTPHCGLLTHIGTSGRPKCRRRSIFPPATCPGRPRLPSGYQRSSGAVRVLVASVTAGLP